MAAASGLVCSLAPAKGSPKITLARKLEAPRTGRHGAGAPADYNRHMPRAALFTLLAIAAAARLLLQVAAMPPYAGLDEGYHVARLAFVRGERRSPTIIEPSVPPYMATNLRGDGLLPSFAELRERWSEVVRARGGHIAVDRPFTSSDLRPYVVPNYEAQQPSLYYSAVAALGGGSALRELRVWRLTSAALALVVILCSGAFAYRFFGTRGILAAALIASFPTWLTLVLRAGNDALACALAALALAITASAPRRPLAVACEALAWAGAVAAKLYTWPLAIVVPLFWRQQRGSRARLAVVTLAGVIAAVVTLHDLSSRTRNPFGHFGFDPVDATATPKPIAYGEMLKIAIASFIWTSGQHADALKPVAMILYFGPLLIAMAAAIALTWSRGHEVARSPGEDERRLIGLTFAAIVAFGIAHLAGAAAFIRHARAAGLSLPLGGKEGWYWYVLAPILAGVFLSLVMKRWRFVAVWVVAWDILINECVLFHDWAGTSSPAHPSVLFRWGPLHAPFTASLDGIGIGPFASQLVLLRSLHLAALAALFSLESLLQKASSHDRNTAVQS